MVTNTIDFNSSAIQKETIPGSKIQSSEPKLVSYLSVTVVPCITKPDYAVAVIVMQGTTVTDRYETNFGFRTLNFTARDGFL